MLPSPDGIGYFVQARPDLRVHVVADGPHEGMPILMLHGFPEYWFSWRHQLNFLGQAGWRAIAADFRGVNHSDKPPQGYDPPSLAADMVGVLDALGYQNAVIMGHDYGGFIGYVMALLFPERVRQLIVINTLHPAKWPNPRLRPNVMKVFSALVHAGYNLAHPLLDVTNQSLGVGGIMKFLAHNRAALPQPIRQAYSRAYKRSGATSLAYAPATATWLAQSPPKHIPLTMPILVLWSEKDFTAPLWVTHSLHQSIPQAQIIQIPQAGHWVQQEQPTSVNQAVVDFLRLHDVNMTAG